MFLGVAALLACTTDAVDRSKFRTCKDASFCRRHRDVVSEPAVRGFACRERLLIRTCGPCAVALSSALCTHSPAPSPQFHVVAGHTRVDAGVVTAQLASATHGAPPFELSFRAYASGAVRLRIIEKNDLPPRWEVRLAASHSHISFA